MRYEMMLPHQIRTAIAEDVPVVLPVGVLEYHGEHMAVGMDTLAVTETLAILDGVPAGGPSAAKLAIVAVAAASGGCAHAPLNPAYIV